MRARLSIGLLALSLSAPVLAGTPPLATGIAAGDLNGDGVADLVVTHSSSRDVTPMLTTVGP